ncbi:GNAT family N-acetyltransferase [Rhodobacteraceae bacterium NNCM2]|nr:GNAT family N-acetyltransferase [Coraliihabitans acroporae]
MPTEIRTERLLLRALRPSDAGPISLYAADPRVARMTTSIPHPYPPGAAEMFIETDRAGRGSDLVWAIDASPIEAAEFVGIISFRPKSSEIGYWIGPPFWNTGYVSEAVEAVIAHVFETGQATRLVERVFADNPASAHVLEKWGFVDAGTDQSFSVARGETVETRLLALDKATWQARLEAEAAAG